MDVAKTIRSNYLNWSYVEPSHTGCWNCLAGKLKENRRVEVDLFGLNNGNLNIPPLSHLPITQIIVMNMAAIEVAMGKISTISSALQQSSDS